LGAVQRTDDADAGAAGQDMRGVEGLHVGHADGVQGLCRHLRAVGVRAKDRL
jgi:hypothetical protein